MIRIEDGEKLEGSYLGVPVSGTVQSSRVKYGGDLQYTVLLDEPVQFRWRSDLTSVVLIDGKDVTSMTIKLAEVV
jgi:hypothetical protein